MAIEPEIVYWEEQEKKRKKEMKEWKKERKKRKESGEMKQPWKEQEFVFNKLEKQNKNKIEEKNLW